MERAVEDQGPRVSCQRGRRSIDLSGNCQGEGAPRGRLRSPAPHEAPGDRRRPGLRLPVQHAHRAPRARDERLLRAPAPRHAVGEDRGAESQRVHPLRRPGQRLRGQRAVRPCRRLRPARAGPRHLLRDAAHGAPTRRARRAQPAPGVRARRPPPERRRVPAVRERALVGAGVDEPRRQGRRDAAGLSQPRLHRQQPRRGHGERRRPHRPPVPP